MADSSSSATAASATADLQARIEALWADRDSIDINDPDVGATVTAAIDALDTGAARVAEWNDDGSVTVNQWCKYAVLLLFKISKMETIEHAPFEYADKIPLKSNYMERGVRVVPGAQARWGSYQAPGVVMMPSYTNIGAYVGEGTMVDTWATVGSCAQIGKNVHLSGGVGIGGVLEPLQANPTIIEDNCFIGARSEVVEGCIIREGSVLGMGVFIGKSTKIVDRETGEVMYGEVPPYSVVVAGSMPSKNNISLYCAVIVKRVDERTRSKTSINELLRD